MVQTQTPSTHEINEETVIPNACLKTNSNRCLLKGRHNYGAREEGKDVTHSKTLPAPKSLASPPHLHHAEPLKLASVIYSLRGNGGLLNGRQGNQPPLLLLSV